MLGLINIQTFPAIKRACACSGPFSLILSLRIVLEYADISAKRWALSTQDLTA